MGHDERTLHEVLREYDWTMEDHIAPTPEEMDIADIVRIEEIVTAEIQRRAAEDQLQRYEEYYYGTEKESGADEDSGPEDWS